ncbi:hypothetical protein ABXJ76_07995 [Methylobacter sp. G7]|uniref:hypothetical protein n=1 Tax=Methylobacter sp. G7 TaxID=3230117 RepID=UPI003D80203B
MNSEQIYEQFNAIEESIRMLCIDAAAAGCFLVQQGHDEAGRKLLRTAITTGELNVSLIAALLDNLPESLDGLGMHVEIKKLFKQAL